MISSYSDIKSIIEELYEENTLPKFVAICKRTLGGRGFNRLELVRASLESVEDIHSVLEPLVNNLIRKNVSLAKQQEDQYAFITLGNNEYRLRKVKDKDKYGRAAGDYIVNMNNGTCTCPEYVTRLQEFTISCKHQHMVEDKMEITQISSKESVLALKASKKVYADFTDDLLEREFYKWSDCLEAAERGEIIFLEDGKYIFKDSPVVGFKNSSTSLIEDLKGKGIPIYPIDQEEEIIQQLRTASIKRLVTLADHFDNKGLSVEANIVDQIIIETKEIEACPTCSLHNEEEKKKEEDEKEGMKEAGKTRGVPDGTGPYGKGIGPGKGKGDGTGLKKDRRKRQVALLELTQSK